MAVEIGDAFFAVGLDMKKVDKALAKFKKVGKVAGAAVLSGIVAVGIGSLKAANTIDTASRNIAKSMGLPVEAAGEFKTIIEDVYRDGFGGTLEDVGEAVQNVANNLQSVGVTGAKDITKITEGALALNKTFDLDMDKSVNAIGELMRQFGLTSQEALDFVAHGMQKGLNASDDFLDSIGEYSVQFKEGGLNAGEFFSIMETGMAGGMLGTDKAADLFKEFRVRILDGSKSTSEALQILGIKEEEFLAKVRSGQMSVGEAFKVVQKNLSMVEDKALAMQAGVGILGTQFEDLGETISLSMTTASTKLGDMGGSTDLISEKFGTLGGAMDGIKRIGVLAFAKIGQAMLPVINERMPQIREAFLKLEELAPKFGEAFASGLDLMLEVMIPAMETFAEFIEQNADLVIVVTAVSAALGVLAFVVAPIVSLIATLGKLLIIAKIGMVALAVGFTGAILPALAIAAAILAVIGIVVRLRHEIWGAIQALGRFFGIGGGSAPNIQPQMAPQTAASTMYTAASATPSQAPEPLASNVTHSGGINVQVYIDGGRFDNPVELSQEVGREVEITFHSLGLARL